MYVMPRILRMKNVREGQQYREKATYREKVNCIGRRPIIGRRPTVQGEGHCIKRRPTVHV